jgi:acetyltransferase-like isoleucine patch superfamily enzyme
MLIDIGEEAYYRIFQVDPHPFLSQKFLQVNRLKVEKILWLVEDNSKPQIGLIAGLKDGNLLSPFSAPFGGFHFHHELIYISVINKFLEELKHFIKTNEFKGIKIKLPPDIYHSSLNSKITNCFFYGGFSIRTIDITNWIDLESYKNWFNNYGPRKCLNQAIKHELIFSKTEQLREKFEAYELIRMNRLRMGRPIFMTFDDLIRLDDIWNVDYFIVSDKNNTIVASSINYRVHNSIIYTVYWGDNENGRTKRAMDFCIFNLLNHYKQNGYQFLDIGNSTENGLPNEGLLRFKEIHEATSSLKFTFFWSNLPESKIASNANNLVMKPIRKYGIVLRLAEVDDAEFILKLRTDPKLNKCISYTSPDLAEQRLWMEIYKNKEREKQEYYFIAEDEEGNRYGTIRLYNRCNNSYEIGSWLFAHNSPLGMAVKAHIIGYELGFELFNAEYCKFEIRKENSAVLRYVEFFKPQIISTDELNVYFQLTKENFHTNKSKIAAFSSGFKNKVNNIYIHPTAEVQSKFIGDGTKIWQYCVVLKNARIGKNCNLNYNVFIENNVIIGDNVTVKTGVQLWDGIRLEDNAFISPNVTFTNDNKPRSKQYPEKFLNTFVKEGASIGANSTIIGGITIGKYSMIGAGSMVTKNIPDYTLWYGNPATYKANICKCGQKLNDLLVCSTCNSAYQSNNGIISEL